MDSVGCRVSGVECWEKSGHVGHGSGDDQLRGTFVYWWGSPLRFQRTKKGLAGFRKLGALSSVIQRLGLALLL